MVMMRSVCGWFLKPASTSVTTIREFDGLFRHCLVDYKKRSQSEKLSSSTTCRNEPHSSLLIQCSTRHNISFKPKSNIGSTYDDE